MIPRISVITPSFNQGPFIERTIRSVLDQPLSGLEYVVMDGGSTDETPHVLASFNGRVTWISEPDGGQSHAVNKGIRRTRGEIIGWLNSDDIYYPNALRTVLDCFDANPNVDVIYGQSNHIDVDDRVIEPYPTEPWSLERLKENCIISQPAAFFRRRAVECWGLLDENLDYCMDYEFWLRLALNGARFRYLPNLLAATRLHAATKTNASAVACHREINEMLAGTLGNVPAAWLYKYARTTVRQTGVTKRQPIRFGLLLLGGLWRASRQWESPLNRSLAHLLRRRRASFAGAQSRTVPAVPAANPPTN
jgi:glycosyltransferase involved in cell wall biosynthesis